MIIRQRRETFILSASRKKEKIRRQQSANIFKENVELP
jgi:hypothetical protein